MKRNPLKTLQNKADRLLQEKNRRENKYCEYCGNECQVGHHYFPKSTSSALRYDMNNIIPLCNGCHMRHHNGDPRVHAQITLIRGEKWYANLLRDKEKITKVSQSYYKEIIEKLNQ